MKLFRDLYYEPHFHCKLFSYIFVRSMWGLNDNKIIAHYYYLFSRSQEQRFYSLQVPPRFTVKSKRLSAELNMDVRLITINCKYRRQPWKLPDNQETYVLETFAQCYISYPFFFIWLWQSVKHTYLNKDIQLSPDMKGRVSRMFPYL